MEFELWCLIGIVLKMSRLIGTGSSQEHNSIADSISDVHARTLIIPAEELVQITEKVFETNKILEKLQYLTW